MGLAPLFEVLCAAPSRRGMNCRWAKQALAGDTPACVGRRAFVSEPDTSRVH